MTVQSPKPGRASVIKALKAHSRSKITRASIEAQGASLEHESDRGTVIMTAAMIEDTLSQALENHLHHLTSKELDALFEFNGPMGTFSAKIKSAQAFKIIDRATRNHIEMIREMRNACAHSQNGLTFKDEILRNAVFSMLTPDAAQSYQNNEKYIRVAFVIMTGVIANIIVQGDVQKGTEKVNEIIEQAMSEHNTEQLT
jgi:hypothetical protein